jgi:hypothetical protein
MNEDYKVLDWSSANSLKDTLKGKEITQLEFDLSIVYLLNDSSYLIMPLNPFGNSLLIYKKVILDKFIQMQHFPIDEEQNKFYLDKKAEIDNLLAEKSSLKKSLYNYIYKRNDNLPTELSANQIDEIYRILKKRRKFNIYKLNFIVLVGDFILGHFRDRNYKWGLLRNKQYLNPIINIIIITDEKNREYFNLENEISNKYGYLGLNYILFSIDSHKTKSNEIEEIVKSLD